MQVIGIGLKNILIAIVATAGVGAVVGLFRGDWTGIFPNSVPTIAIGLLAAASMSSAQEGFEAGARSADRLPPG